MKEEELKILNQLSPQQEEKMLSTLKQAYKAINRKFPETPDEQNKVLASVLISLSTIQDLGKDENGNSKAKRLNIYTDGKDAYFVTVEINQGTAPLMLKMPNTKILMKSLCYIVPQDIEPTHEWYKPCLEEHKLLQREMREHVAKGGLLLRRIGEGYKTSFKKQIRNLTNKKAN
jgi:hypothetical protein